MFSRSQMLQIAALTAMMAALVACRHTPDAPPPDPFPPEPEFQVQYSPGHDEEIKEILSLARRNMWEEAQDQSTALYFRDPDNKMVQRVHTWVHQEGQRRRDRALEDEIRDITMKGSVFHVTPESLLTEKRHRGLPPRKDVRDAIQQIEATPYVPDSFGRTAIQERGPLYDFDAPGGRMQDLLNREVSIHLDNVTLEAIIFQIGQAEEINFVADKSIPAFAQQLSVNMERVKLSEFLRYVSRNLGVQFQVGEDLIWIVDGADPAKLMEETRFYRLRRGFIIPAQFGPTEVIRQTVTTPQNVRTETVTSKSDQFVRDGAPENPAIEAAIQNFFEGKYQIDYERNLIVARGTAEQLRVLERIIEEFDRPVQQVLIEARFITISQAAFLQLGASWETGRQATSDRQAMDFTGLAHNIGAMGLGLQESFTNILDRENLSVTLTALEQSGESQTLSAPRLTLVNNLPATISDGKVQFYYEEYTVSQTITDRAVASSLAPKGRPVSLTSGASLDVLASIGGDGRSILLALRPKVIQDVQMLTFASVTHGTGAERSVFEIVLPEYRTQDLSTRVVVQSGQTVVMGGVLEREQLTFVESVPLLGNIPIIGAAFRKRTEVDKPRYLLIFVTATLLSESGEFLLVDDEP